VPRQYLMFSKTPPLQARHCSSLMQWVGWRCASSQPTRHMGSCDAEVYCIYPTHQHHLWSQFCSVQGAAGGKGGDQQLAVEQAARRNGEGRPLQGPEAPRPRPRLQGLRGRARGLHRSFILYLHSLQPLAAAAMDCAEGTRHPATAEDLHGLPAARCSRSIANHVPILL
jgi:hypothetical protein